MTFLRIYTVIFVVVCMLTLIKDIIDMISKMKSSKYKDKYFLWEIGFFIALIPILLLALICK